MENLDFADARSTGRETLGRGQRAKRLRRTIAGIPTARFRTRLTGMASRRGIAVIGVDPAYTSRWGNQHWRKPLQQQTSEPVTAHHGAAVAIGRLPGWMAHWREMNLDPQSKIGRPQQLYVGEPERTYPSA